MPHKPHNLRRKRFTLAALAGLMMCVVWLSGLRTSYAQQTVLVSTGIERFFDIAWSNSGDWIAVASSVGVLIFDESLNEVARFQSHAAAVTSVSWSPDDRYLATSGGDGDSAIRIWNWNGATEEFTLEAAFLENEEFRFIQTISWSPTGTILAVMGINQPRGWNDVLGTVQLWNTSTWTLNPTFDWQYENPSWSLAWSSDGTLLAGSESGPDVRIFTYVMSIVTGDVVMSIPFVEAASSVDISADNRLALGIYSLPVFDLDSRQIISVLNIPYGRPQWIPGQNRLAIVGLDMGQIVDVSTNEILLTFDSVEDLLAFEVSPDGQQLAQISRAGDIQVRFIGGLPPSTLATVTPIFTRTPSLTPSPTMSPTVSFSVTDTIAFSVQTSETPSIIQMYTMATDGTNLTLFDATAAHAFAPSWSPDGSRLAFASRPDESSPYQIYVANSDTSGLLLVPPDSASNYDPAWSRDGQRIVFTLERFGNKEIYSIITDGTLDTIIRLTDDPAEDYQPDWSSLNRIAFVSARAASGSPDIYSINSLGGDIRNISNTPDIIESHPTWSPTGTRIAFIATQNGVSRLNIMNANGTNRMEYVEIADVPFDWSPDGSQLVIISPENTINIFEPSTGSNIVILNDTNPKFGVSWSNGQGSVALPSPTPTPSAHARYTADPPVPASLYTASTTPIFTRTPSPTPSPTGSP